MKQLRLGHQLRVDERYASNLRIGLFARIPSCFDGYPKWVHKIDYGSLEASFAAFGSQTQETDLSFC